MFHGFAAIIIPRLLPVVTEALTESETSNGEKNNFVIVLLCDDKNDSENDSTNNKSSSIPIVCSTKIDRRLVLKYRCMYMYRNNKKLLFRNKDFLMEEFLVPLRRRKLPLRSFFCSILFRNDATPAEEEDVVWVEVGVPTTVCGCTMDDCCCCCKKIDDEEGGDDRCVTWV